MNRGIYTSLCPYGEAPPPKPLWLGLYPSIPKPQRYVVIVSVPETLSTIKYDCYRNIRHSASMRLEQN